jgi:peroxiredoxin
MTINVGDQMPAGTLTVITKEGMQKVSATDYFKGKKVVLFSLPGAFTPTCDGKHLPGFVERAADIKGKGVNTIACLSVNDAYVMKAWGKAQNTEDKVDMLADGNADYTKALGLDVDASAAGPKGEFKVSSAEYVLEQMNS